MFFLGGEKEDDTDLIVLSPDDDFCLGLIARDRVCLQRRDLCDIAKHGREKLRVTTDAFHILDPANGQRKASAFKEPSIQVQGLSAKQMHALTTDLHSVQEWHCLFTSLRVVRFEGDDEFEDVKRRATKKVTIGAAFTPNKRAQVRYESPPPSVPPTVLFGINYEGRQQLQAVSLAPGDEELCVSAQQWNALCAYLAARDTQLPMLRRYVKEFRSLTEARLEEVEDELGAVVAEVGNRVEVSGGPHPTLWKGVSSNFETSLAMGSDFKRVLDDVSEMELTMEQMEGKVEQVMREIGGLNREVIQISTLRSGFQDQRTKVTEIDAKILMLSTLLQSVDTALLGSAATGTSGDLIDGKPLPDVVKTLILQAEVIQSQMKSQSVHMGGISFESYEDTYRWVCTHLNENDWTYILDMPGLYSLVRHDGNTFPSQLEKEANDLKAGYGNANNARLALSFNSMIPDIFEPGKKSKVEGHPFPAIDTVNKLESSGI
jgi:hypothetical protein